MSLISDIDAYEAWLGTRCAVVKKGLDKKHRRMAKSAFNFFRATCFRFARQLPELLPELADAPEVPSVGDAHIENWGTWRDGEGRLVWGVNDFDEATSLPYTYDLLRLAVSSRLALGLPGTGREREVAILQGYTEGLEAPRPHLVDDETPWMQALVNRPAATQGAFSAELAKIEPETPPPEVLAAFHTLLPSGTTHIEMGARQRGGGSLGRPRFVAHGLWQGGPIVREAKALVPSAWDWAAGAPAHNPDFKAMAGGPYRSPDPFLSVHGNFVYRRLASDSTKIDLSNEDALAYGPKLMAAMGADLASIHVAGHAKAQAIKADLARRGETWLHDAAKVAETAVHEDFTAWQAHHAKVREADADE